MIHFGSTGSSRVPTPARAETGQDHLRERLGQLRRDVNFAERMAALRQVLLNGDKYSSSSSSTQGDQDVPEEKSASLSYRPFTHIDAAQLPGIQRKIHQSPIKSRSDKSGIHGSRRLPNGVLISPVQTRQDQRENPEPNALPAFSLPVVPSHPPRKFRSPLHEIYAQRGRNERGIQSPMRTRAEIEDSPVPDYQPQSIYSRPRTAPNPITTRPEPPPRFFQMPARHPDPRRRHRVPGSNTRLVRRN